jgi:hypothetical protein
MKNIYMAAFVDKMVKKIENINKAMERKNEQANITSELNWAQMTGLEMEEWIHDLRESVIQINAFKKLMNLKYANHNFVMITLEPIDDIEPPPLFANMIKIFLRHGDYEYADVMHEWLSEFNLVATGANKTQVERRKRIDILRLSHLEQPLCVALESWKLKNEFMCIDELDKGRKVVL